MSTPRTGNKPGPVPGPNISIEDMVQQLAEAGWKRLNPTRWADPNGNLYLGPFGAWKAMKGVGNSMDLVQTAGGKVGETKWMRSAQQRVDVDPETFPPAPLCADHAAVWFTARNTLKPASGCVFCDAEQEIIRLTAETEVRSKLSIFPPQPPTEHVKARSQWKSGYEAGWRGHPMDNLYARKYHQNAYIDGVKVGRTDRESLVQQVVRKANRTDKTVVEVVHG